MCLAIPGKIVEIYDDGDEMNRKGKIYFGGITKTASLAFVPEAKTGDYALVHAGVAISTIDEDEAQKVFEYLEEINGLDENL